MANTTLSSVLGGITVHLPVSSDPSNTVAQAALDSLTSKVSSGSLNISAYNPLATIQGSTVQGTVPTAVVVQPLATIAGTTPALAQITLSGNNTEVVNTDTSGGTVAIISSTVSSTLIAGGGSNNVYINRSTMASVLLTGGNSYIANNDSTGTTNTTLTGGQSLGDGRAYIDASVGAANVTVGNNGLINANQGSTGSVNIVAQQGTVVVAISQPMGGSSTVAATVAGATVAGSRLIYIQNGGNAFINPNASDVVVLAGSNTGSETVAGGSGSETVFGGRGMFTGGLAGGNVLLGSTVNGVTTLIGAGKSDTLIAQAGGDVLRAGSGTDVLAAIVNSTVTVGNTFITGSGVATVLGGITGNNTIGFGSGSALAYGQHGTVAASLVGNTYNLYAAAGSDTIGDFVVGKDVFKISTGYVGGATPAVTVAGSTVGGANLVVTLSDKTQITFVNGSTFSTTSIFS